MESTLRCRTLYKFWILPMGATPAREGKQATNMQMKQILVGRKRGELISVARQLRKSLRGQGWLLLSTKMILDQRDQIGDQMAAAN